MNEISVTIQQTWEKSPKTKGEIERLIVAEMQTFADCKNAKVIVVPIVDHAANATWTVSRFKRGNSDGDACDRALQRIVPHFQRVYDMVQKH